MVSETCPNDPSRDRLLQAAVEIFADRGFRDATVRELCKRAGVNVASVNYYFRSKEALYGEALAFAFREAEQRYPLTEARDKSLPPEVRLTHFIRVFLYRLLDDSALGYHGKLIAREIADPTKALDEIVKTIIAPTFGILDEIVQQLLGPGWDRKDVHRCILGILGQCLVFKHSRSVIDRTCPEIIASSAEIERCAGHIARFSLAGLRELAGNAKGIDP